MFAGLKDLRKFVDMLEKILKFHHNFLLGKVRMLNHVYGTKQKYFLYYNKFGNANKLCISLAHVENLKEVVTSNNLPGGALYQNVFKIFVDKKFLISTRKQL